MTELMLIVAIIATLTAIAVPKAADSIRHAQESRTKYNLGALRSALGMYYAENEGYPLDSLASLVPKYLRDIPAKYTPPFHPEGNEVSAGPIAAQVAAKGDWFYVNDKASFQFGAIMVNCVHADLKGEIWTTL